MENNFSDTEDQRFEQMIADKQHKELMSALKQLVASIKTNQSDDNKTFDAISKYNKDLFVFLNDINKSINNNNNTEPESSMKALEEGQNKIIELLSLKPIRLVPTINYGKIEYVDIVWEDVTKEKNKYIN
jgi:histidyl-tRNA synthetase